MIEKQRKIQAYLYSQHYEVNRATQAGFEHQGGNNMKKLLFGTIFLTLLTGCVMAPYQPDAYYNSPLSAPDAYYGPPPIAFLAPPDVIVIPDTDDVYVVPDLDIDLFFWNGFWWRPWEGRWYRSQYYDRGWAYYNNVPSFYFDVDLSWRGYYRDRNWYGHRWDYERVPHQRLQQNWQGWQKNRRWERQGTWGVQNYRPRPPQQRQELRQQRERQYRQSPEVQRPQRQPQVQQPREQPEERVQQPQRHEQRPEAQEPQQFRPRGRTEGGDEEPRR